MVTCGARRSQPHHVPSLGPGAWPPHSLPARGSGGAQSLIPPLRPAGPEEDAKPHWARFLTQTGLTLTPAPQDCGEDAARNEAALGLAPGCVTEQQKPATIVSKLQRDCEPSREGPPSHSPSTGPGTQSGHENLSSPQRRGKEAGGACWVRRGFTKPNTGGGKHSESNAEGGA